MFKLPVTDPSIVSLADPKVNVVVRNRWVKDDIRLYKTRQNRDGCPVWTILQLAEIWQVSRRRVIAAIAGEPVEYVESMVPVGTNHREERKEQQSKPRARHEGGWPYSRVSTRQVAVRGDIADRIYRDKIRPTLKTR